jgi:ABC-2 type transport system permease protein
MNTEKIWTIVRKEWAEVFKNRLVLFAVAFLPLIMTVIPLVILATTGSVEAGDLVLEEIPPEFAAFCNDELSGEECLQTFVATQFLILFLIMPVIIPVTIASYSIVGEKTTRTLEPLLATPISTTELLAGKALAAALPALAATWISFLIFNVGALLITDNPGIINVFAQPMWLLAIFGLAPLLSIAAVSVAVMISSRVNDPRVAEQLSGMVVIPVIALLLGQTFGLFILNRDLIFYFSLAVGIIDVILLYLASQIFQRETILTRWK